MSKLTIQLIILTTLVVGWTIFMLYQRHQHKKRMRQIDKEWEERRRRWAEQVPFDSQVPTEWVRRSAMMPNEGYMPSAMFKTDKLSPKKSMKVHKLNKGVISSCPSEGLAIDYGVYTREVDHSHVRLDPNINIGATWLNFDRENIDYE